MLEILRCDYGHVISDLHIMERAHQAWGVGQHSSLFFSCYDLGLHRVGDELLTEAEAMIRFAEWGMTPGASNNHFNRFCRAVTPAKSREVPSEF